MDRTPVDTPDDFDSLSDDRPSQTDLMGTVIGGRYQPIAPIGRCAGGDLYLAAGVSKGAQVSVLVLDPGVQIVSLDLRALNHPNIARLLDVVEEPRTVIAYEALSGQCLADLLEEKKKLDLDLATDIAMQILGGLRAVHSQNIVARSLQASGVWIKTRQDNRVRIKLVGLGLAGPPNDPVAPHYSAPEQLTARGVVDRRADIWAVGVLLFEMLLGRKPFIGENSKDLMGKILLRDPPLGIATKRIPEGLLKVIEVALKKEPELRYRNATVMAEALKPFSGLSAAVTSLAPGAQPVLSRASVAAAAIPIAKPILSRAPVAAAAVPIAKPVLSRAPVAAAAVPIARPVAAKSGAPANLVSAAPKPQAAVASASTPAKPAGPSLASPSKTSTSINTDRAMTSVPAKPAATKSMATRSAAIKPLPSKPAAIAPLPTMTADEDKEDSVTIRINIESLLVATAPPVDNSLETDNVERKGLHLPAAATGYLAIPARDALLMTEAQVSENQLRRTDPVLAVGIPFAIEQSDVHDLFSGFSDPDEVSAEAILGSASPGDPSHPLNTTSLVERARCYARDHRKLLLVASAAAAGLALVIILIVLMSGPNDPGAIESNGPTFADEANPTLTTSRQSAVGATSKLEPSAPVASSRAKPAKHIKKPPPPKKAAHNKIKRAPKRALVHKPDHVSEPAASPRPSPKAKKAERIAKNTPAEPKAKKKGRIKGKKGQGATAKIETKEAAPAAPVMPKNNLASNPFRQ